MWTPRLSGVLPSHACCILAPPQQGCEECVGTHLLVCVTCAHHLQVCWCGTEPWAWPGKEPPCWPGVTLGTACAHGGDISRKGLMGALRVNSCSSSVTKLCLNLWETMDCSMPDSPILHCLLEFVQIHVHWVSDANYIILCHPLLLWPSIFPYQGLSNESAPFIKWPKYWSFNFSSSPSNEYLVLIFFRTDWFNLLAVQGTLKSLLQHHSSTASFIQPSTFFIVQLSHPYMTTGKTIALSIWTFVSKVISLLFNTLSRFVIALLPRSKYLLISWLQSPSEVILESQKIKSVTVSTVCPSICHEMMGWMPWS